MSNRFDDYTLGERGEPFAYASFGQRKTRDLLPFVAGPALEVGCYRGEHTAFFARQDIAIEGSDVSKKNLGLAKRNFPGINFFYHDFSQDRLKKDYQTIILFDVIEHVFEVKAFLENLKESLREGGRLIVSTPNYASLACRVKMLLGRPDFLLYNDLGGKMIGTHIRFFDRHSLKRVIKEAGFEIEKEFAYSTAFLPLPKSLCGSLTIIARRK